MSIITCRDIARRALRKISGVAAGTSLDGDTLVDAVETLQAIYLELAGHGMFGTLWDVVVDTATYDAIPQSRILANRLGGVAITLPTLVDPDSYNLGWGMWDYEFRDYYWGSTPRPPHDGACIEINSAFDDTQETWVYESSAARWINLRALAPNSPAPLSKYTDGLAGMLAARMASEFGMQVPPEVEKTAALAKYALTHRNDGQRGTQYAPERFF